MKREPLAILFSGGTDSVSLYALAAIGRHSDVPRPSRIHLLHMLNGMSRFHAFPEARFRVAERIIKSQAPETDPVPEADYVELDMGRLFQGLWLDWYEDLMPRYGGKNLVCAACKLGMHVKAIIYCRQHSIPLLLVGYAEKQDYYPEQTRAFMDRIAAFSESFGVATRFPLYEDFAEDMVTRHLLEEFGLPSTGGGERKCLFCQTRTTATEAEIGAYVEDMLPRLREYVEHKLAGRIKEAAQCFPPGR
ncbi:MAG: hypothetical protein KKB20_24870 [Proteobacteria bacterium]|nr:hypothetical protein [Pseudomonadota bacterium]